MDQRTDSQDPTLEPLEGEVVFECHRGLADSHAARGSMGSPARVRLRWQLYPDKPRGAPPKG